MDPLPERKQVELDSCRADPMPPPSAEPLEARHKHCRKARWHNRVPMRLAAGWQQAERAVKAQGTLVRL